MKSTKPIYAVLSVGQLRALLDRAVRLRKGEPETLATIILYAEKTGRQLNNIRVESPLTEV